MHTVHTERVVADSAYVHLFTCRIKYGGDTMLLARHLHMVYST